MWTRSAFARGQSVVAPLDMHIYEKKKRGLCADPLASSFSKYANPDIGHHANREGCQ